jgi:hypothetical protein
MSTQTLETELNIVQEPQLDILYYPKTNLKLNQEIETFNVLSLF